MSRVNSCTGASPNARTGGISFIEDTEYRRPWIDYNTIL